MARPLDLLLSPEEQERVVDAIRRAERRTSGQIKVHVEARCSGDALARATRLFPRLGLTRTRARNGVLLYVAARDRKFAIVGDRGIHGAARPEFFHRAATVLREWFARGRIADGLIAGVELIGEKLAEHYPPYPGAENELSDELV
ncbi:MAG TPA: TPM domain-containing protein [Polyangia bacterium]|nr:TPM domain-containing protein [Polyangia bacterium]